MSGSWTAAAPVLPLLAAALFYLVAERRLRSAGREVAGLGLLALASSGLLLYFLSFRSGESFGGLLAYDGVSAAMGAVVLAAGAAAMLLAPAYLERRGLGAGDFTALVLFAVAGLLVLVSARELLTAVLALETASVCLYALTGYDRGRESSAEAALKYFLPGAAASALLLYGAACYYGATGSTRLAHATGLASPLGMVAGGLLVAGLAFKAGLVPFHGWLPDAYAGAPSPATGFMAAAVKAGAFAFLARLVAAGLPGDAPRLQGALAALAVATMTFGNLVGLAQTGLKRLLAYSAIAHSGTLMLGVLAVGRGASAAPMASYLAAYGVLTLGAFAAAGALESPATGGLELSQLKGLGRRRPVLAYSLAFCLLGLAGFPPTAGFLAKVNLFGEAYARGLGGLVVAAVLNSALALGYYLKPLKAMFMEELPEGARPPDVEGIGAASALAFACGAGGLLMGLLPSFWI